LQKKLKTQFSRLINSKHKFAKKIKNTNFAINKPKTQMCKKFKTQIPRLINSKHRFAKKIKNTNFAINKFKTQICKTKIKTQISR